MIINKKNITRISLHIFFWVAYLLFYTILYGFISGNFIDVLLQSLFTLPIDMSITYFAIYYLIPKFLLKRYYALYLFTLVISMLMAGAAERLLNHFYVYPFFYPSYIPANFPIFTPRFFNMTISVYSVVILASAIKILKYWVEERHRRMDLEIQNQSSELALLRNQINPHFLFNTLNNIHTLILKDSDKAADALLKLSEIMRYMLYEANVDEVPLEKELEYVASYIDLQKLRLPNPEIVKYQVNCNANRISIAPMILIPFVENAFKHSKKNSSKDLIQIQINFFKNILFFSSTNQIKDKAIESFELAKGIGLKNVKRRLELLYPNRYTLKISSIEKIFEVQLTLQYDN